MSYVKSLVCKECSREYPVEPLNVCDFCFGPLEVTYDYDAISRVISRERIESGPRSMWRYHDLLPADAENAIDINAGYTPLIKANNLAKALGLEELYLKNDAVNPSFSFKDRVVAVASTKAREFGFDTLACASTGNLAGSVAAHAARAGMRAFVFIPADLERGKIVGAAVYGATLVAVDGSYDDVNRLCSELSDNYNWAFVNISTCGPTTPRAARVWDTRWPSSLGGGRPTTAWCPARQVRSSRRYGRVSMSSLRWGLSAT